MGYHRALQEEVLRVLKVIAQVLMERIGQPVAASLSSYSLSLLSIRFIAYSSLLYDTLTCQLHVNNCLILLKAMP